MSCKTKVFSIKKFSMTVTLIIIFITVVNGNEDYGNMVLSNIIYRHGDRSPISTYPNDPFIDIQKLWPQGLGGLSTIGKIQHHELGRYIRNRYKNFLPLKYNTSDTYVRSSDLERCIMSAQSNLMGLYPLAKNTKTEPLLYQIVPIHTAPLQNDMLFFPFVNCRRYKAELSLLENSKGYRCIQAATALVQEDVSRNAGYKTFDSVIYDTIHVQNLYNLPVPEWAKNYYPQQLEALRLLEFLIKTAGTRELQRLTIGQLLKEMVTNMINKTQSTLNPDRKLFMYSAHDTTISHLFMSLDMHNGIIPPYASAVFLELRVKYGNYYVLISYRNSSYHEPYVLKLPRCDILCPLDDFVKLTAFLIPKDFASECNSDPVIGTLVHFLIPSYGVPKSWKKCFPEGKTLDGRYYVISYTNAEQISDVLSNNV